MDVIFAKTHPADYLLHKYWARKPHNVLSRLISELISDDEALVLDPFCGSGVFLREASKLGHKAYGFDVNPVAALLSDVTCNPPALEDFQAVFEPLLSDFQKLSQSLFNTTCGDTVKYYVHETVVKCKKCGRKQTKQLSNNTNNKNFCFNCDNKLSFSLSNLCDTEIVAVATKDGLSVEQMELNLAKQLEHKNIDQALVKFDLEFQPNNRILAYEGMTTKDLFTNRNFFLISSFATEIHKIGNEKIKRAALVLLTASVAQCSRLIAYRNNLTSGGPAWSVPGFWVPAKHLESNPYNHLSTRYKKFCRGLNSLNAVKTKPVYIFNEDSYKVSSRLKNKKADLIFLDPPYGDSVPYMEFSMIWNSFLNEKICVEKDISVSDRNQDKANSWKNYKGALKERINICQKALSDNGKFLITFNNHDYRAWEALIEALQQSEMVCESTIYQIPAVVSSKAQFSKDGSYISDIYSVYKKIPNFKPIENLSILEENLVTACEAREGKITKSLLLRVAFTSILKNNIHFNQLKFVDDLVKDIFILEKNIFKLRDVSKSKGNVVTLESKVSDILKTYVNAAPIEWNEFYRDVLISSDNIGAPEPDEVLKYVGKSAQIWDGHLCINGKSNTSGQLTLFE